MIDNCKSLSSPSAIAVNLPLIIPATPARRLHHRGDFQPHENRPLVSGAGQRDRGF